MSLNLNYFSEDEEELSLSAAASDIEVEEQKGGENRSQGKEINSTIKTKAEAINRKDYKHTELSLAKGIIKPKNTKSDKRKVLPRPPDIVFDKYYKAPALGLAENKAPIDQQVIEQIRHQSDESISSNSRNNSKVNDNTNNRKNMFIKRWQPRHKLDLANYFYTEFRLSKQQLQSLDQIICQLNSTILQQVNKRFRLDQRKLNKTLANMRNGTGINGSLYFTFTNDPIFKSIGVPQFDVLFKRFNRKDDSEQVEDYNGQLLQIFNNQPIPSAERSALGSGGGGVQRHEDDRGPEVNSLFTQLYYSQFGSVAPLHFSLTVDKRMAPYSTIKQSVSSRHELKKLVRMYDEYRVKLLNMSDTNENPEIALDKKQETELSLSLFQKIVKQDVPRNDLKLKFEPRLFLRPNKYFTKLFLTLEIDKPSWEKLAIFRKIFLEIDYYKKYTEPLCPSRYHVSIATIPLKFSDAVYSALFAEELLALLKEFNETKLEKETVGGLEVVIDNLKIKTEAEVLTMRLSQIN